MHGCDFYSLDATLTVSELKSVLKCVRSIDEVIAWITPRGKWQARLRNICPSEEEGVHKSLQFYCGIYPEASWGHMAVHLYRICDEFEAAENAKAFMSHGTKNIAQNIEISAM